MTENKRFKEEFLEEMNEIKKEKSERVTVDDIIGLIKTDEPTNSVEEVRKLRGRDDNNFYWYKKYKEVLNENEQLKSENKRLQGKASSWKITASEQIMEQSELMKENVQLKSLFKSKGVQLNKVMNLLVRKEYAQMFIQLQDVLYDLAERGLID